MINIVEKCLEFIRHQLGQELKTLTPSQMPSQSTLFKTWKQFLSAVKIVKRVTHTDED